MTNKEKLTSKEWLDKTNYLIIDPDGWDRKNFEQSWSEEITNEEFGRRIFESTIGFKPIIK